MKKISTLFKKDPNDLGKVINELDPQNEWVMQGDGIPTRKFDGTASAIIKGSLYKRYDVKRGKQVPLNAIPCQEPDEITGHWPHWVKCDRENPADKYHFIAFDAYPVGAFLDGTYELCGEKIQGNPEHITGHQLIPHGVEVIYLPNLTFEGIKDFLSDDRNDIEGIVFHHKDDGRMCKIRKSDFGIKRY